MIGERYKCDIYALEWPSQIHFFSLSCCRIRAALQVVARVQCLDQFSPITEADAKQCPH
jgi:hypothetical protein